jgi:hypothetical protein
MNGATPSDAVQYVTARNDMSTYTKTKAQQTVALSLPLNSAQLDISLSSQGHNVGAVSDDLRVRSARRT